MSEVVGSATVEIRADTSRFEPSLIAGTRRGASRAGDMAGKQFGTDFQRGFRSRVVGFGAGFFAGALGVRQIARLGAQAVQVASNVAEQTSKTEQVFGQATASVVRFSETSVRQLGLAEDQVLEIAGSFGALLRPLGVVESVAAEQAQALTKLGADLASFYNTDVSDALAAIRSGLVGEVEPLRRYGVVLSQTRVEQAALAESGKDSAKELTNQEKVLARIGIVFSDARLAVGDFERTSSGLANQQRILSAAVRQTEGVVGEALIPVVKDVTTELAAWFSNTENQERVQRAVKQAVADTISVVKAFADVVRTVKTVLDPVVDALGGVRRAAELAFGAALTLKLAKATRAMRIFGASAAAAGAQASVSSPFAGGVAGIPATGRGARAGGRLLGAAATLPLAVPLSEQIRRLEIGPGGTVDENFRALGETVGAAADKLGLFGGKIDLSRASIEADTQAILKRKQTTELETLRLNRNLNQTAGPAVAGGSPLSQLARRPRSTISGNLSFQIRELQAQQSASTADDLKVFGARREFIQNQISNIERFGARGRNDQNRLIRLYEELGRVTGEIGSIEEAAAQQREQQAEERKRRAEEEKQRRQKELEQAKAERQAERDRRQRLVDLRGSRLALRVQQAELTKTTKDDRAALRAQIRFYGEQSRNARRTGALAKAVEAESSKAAAQLALRGLRPGNQSTGGPRTDFFQEAANQFRLFGSNIGRAGDPLSGQQARGQFAGVALERGRNTAALTLGRLGEQLQEAQLTNTILRGISAALRGTAQAAGSLPPRRTPPQAIALARDNARSQLAGR